jgi:tetratricopeptide (TPR) repeat protein
MGTLFSLIPAIVVLAAEPPPYIESLRAAQAATDAKDWPAAAAAWQQVVTANPVNGMYWWRLASARFQNRQHAEAIPAYEQVLKLGYRTRSNAVYQIGVCHALLGQKDQALSALERAFALGYRYVDEARADENLASLRGEPRFRSLVGLVDRAAFKRDAGWRYDLAFLAREVKRKSYAPFRDPRGRDVGPVQKLTEAEFDAAVARLRARIPSLTEAQILLELARLLQRVGDGHTGLWVLDEPALPLSFFLFEEGLFVIAADKAHESLLGARVIAFDRRNVEQLVDALKPLISTDNETWVKQVAPFRLRGIRTLHTLGLVSDPKRVALQIVDMVGTTRTVTVEADESEPSIWNKLPAPPSWVTFTAKHLPEPRPLYLRRMDAAYWFEPLPAHKSVYAQCNRVANDEREALAAFAERLVQFVEENPVEKLVLDLRWNNGGDTFVNEALLHALMRSKKLRQPGRFFLIIGRRTYSAAQNATSYFERHLQPVIIGEPTGGRPNSAGDETPQTLPYSGTMFNLSDIFWQGGWPYDDRQWVAPHIYTPPTFADFRNSKDPALEAALAY